MTMPFSKYFDHTLLKPDATIKDIEKLCGEAVRYDFYSVCVNGFHVPLARTLLESMGAYCGIGEATDSEADPATAPSSVKITAVVGFPLGAAESEVKAYEANNACLAGASEIDMVINMGIIKSAYLYEKAGEITSRDLFLSLAAVEVGAVKKVCDKYGATLKVILETGAYTGLSADGSPRPFTKKSKQQLRLACWAALAGGADFLKTSTGFGYGGATTKALAIMKEEAQKSATSANTPFKFKPRPKATATLKSKTKSPAKLKASGGIRDLATAQAMINAGADRLGTSATVAIMEEYLAKA